ncbi:glycoside hydrolase family 3 protein [Azospirillum brasilense]|uniref:glycoside hydrolase family 3 protein n=1 Tax=Azospirillum brasilense TaxID=192 RepID=UPI00190A5873|nr:glycoside hydrolase family 3 protein [Azospirillum brasilense]MBK3736914.1 glycoside hydrolase family 3 protein [Azospirillum brasilense]
MSRVIGWCLGLLLVAAGANIHDPYLMAVRGWSGPVIAVAGLCGLLIVLRRGVRRRVAMLALWAAVPLAVLGAEGIFQLRKASVLSVPEAVASELGRHFMVGYERVGEVEGLAARGLIAVSSSRGAIWPDRRRRICATRSAGCRTSAGAPGSPPLRVAADQEGGIVSKLSPWLPNRPAPSALAGLPPDERRAAARALGRDHGRDLRSLGVTINFAPGLDLRTGGAPDLLDFNSLIARRAISSDPAVVGDIAAAYADGLAETGVQPTVKHFPGLGRVGTDTHHFRAAIGDSRETLESTDWRPFHHVLAGNPQALLMVGHVILSAVDPDRPASHSRRVVDGVIRRDWGYDGLVVTDDLVMTPVYQYGLCRAVEEALNAGVDLLLMAFDGAQFYRAMACAMDAARRGELHPTALAASRERLGRSSAEALP